MIIIAISCLMVLIPFLIINSVNYQFHSDLTILGLDILDVSAIDFVLSPDNQIYLKCYSCYYNNSPCYRSIALAELIGADLKVIDNQLHWIINGTTVHRSYDGAHILIIPTGNVISYEQRSRYSTDIGKTVMTGILRDSSDNKYIMKNISYADQFAYKIIDTYDWNK